MKLFATLVQHGHDESKLGKYSIPKFFTYVFAIEELEAQKTAADLNTAHMAAQGSGKDVSAAVKTLLKKKKKVKPRVKQ